MALFGSVLHEQCGPDSDVDLLVTFEPEADWSLLDHIQMEEELSVLLGRPVDLVSRRAIERSDNWIHRQAILETAEVVYAARGGDPAGLVMHGRWTHQAGWKEGTLDDKDDQGGLRTWGVTSPGTA